VFTLILFISAFTPNAITLNSNTNTNSKLLNLTQVPNRNPLKKRRVRNTGLRKREGTKRLAPTVIAIVHYL